MDFGHSGMLNEGEDAELLGPRSLPSDGSC